MKNRQKLIETEKILVLVKRVDSSEITAFRVFDCEIMPFYRFPARQLSLVKKINRNRDLIRKNEGETKKSKEKSPMM